jgi:hypothetical protein
MKQDKNMASGSAAIVIAGMVILGVPLFLMLIGAFKSPELVLVCLPIGLGLIMWAGIKERNVKIAVITFTIGLVITFIGMSLNVASLLVIGGIASALGAFSWSLFKD